MNDGTITFSTALDNKTLEKQYAAEVRKIESLNDKIEQKRAERAPVADQSAQISAQLDAAKAQLDMMKNASVGTYSTDAIAEQEARVKGLQAEWNSVQGEVERYDKQINNASIELSRNEEKAGALAAELNTAGEKTWHMSEATQTAGKHMTMFSNMLERTLIRATSIVFIYKAIEAIIDYIKKAVEVTPQAAQAVAQLKAAFLTLAQPLLGVIIPALTAFIRILTQMVIAIARVLSAIFGTTIAKSEASAKALNDQEAALNGVGEAAKKATKSLAPFDEIQQLTANDAGGGAGGKAGSIKPDFSGINTDENWLKDYLGNAAGWVTAGLMLGGLALVAIGAATGSITRVIAGLAIIAAGVYVGEETGVLQSWTDTLGLKQVPDFLVAALLLAGIAFIAIGAMIKNLGLIIGGVGMLGAGVAYGDKEGTFKNWWDVLCLPQVAGWITTALLVGGIALTVIGICIANIPMLVGGLLMIGAGITFGIESGTFKNWWDVLNLPKVAGWVTTGLLVGGIALTVIGICIANIPMLIGGLLMIGAGITFGIESGTFKNWWDVLNLPQVAQWVEAALSLGGIGLIVFGICTGNLVMLLAGLGMLGAAAGLSATSGVSLKKAIEDSLRDVLNAAIALFDRFIDWVNEKLHISWDAVSIAGQEIIPAGSYQILTIPHIPPLATGAVIPPNKEFLALLGDQKSGTNIEAPEDLIRRIVREESGSKGPNSITVIMEYDRREFGRVIYDLNNETTQRVGVRLAT